MTRRAEQEPTVIGLEYYLNELPREFQSAVKFASAHDRQILVGYVEDEKKVYLMTVELSTT